MKFLRHLLGITKLDKGKNQCIRAKTGAENIIKEIKQYQEKWLQHIQRMDTNRIRFSIIYKCRSRWPCGLRRDFAAVRLLGLWVRIPPGKWMSVAAKCSVLSSRGLCVGLITRPEDSTEWGVSECDLQASKMRRPCPTRGCCALEKKRSCTNSSTFHQFIFLRFNSPFISYRWCHFILFIYLLFPYFADKFINYSFFLIN